MKAARISTEREIVSLPSLEKKHLHNLSPITSIGSDGSPRIEEAPIFPQPRQPDLPPSQAAADKDLIPDEYRQRQRYWNTVLEPNNCPQQIAETNPYSKLPKQLARCTFPKRTSVLAIPNLVASQPPQRMASLIENMMTSSVNSEAEQSNANVNAIITAHHTLPRPGISVLPVSKRKRFKCHLCPATFAQRGDMMRHIRVKGNAVLPLVNSETLHVVNTV